MITEQRKLLGILKTYTLKGYTTENQLKKIIEALNYSVIIGRPFDLNAIEDELKQVQIFNDAVKNDIRAWLKMLEKLWKEAESAQKQKAQNSSSPAVTGETSSTTSSSERGGPDMTSREVFVTEELRKGFSYSAAEALWAAQPVGASIGSSPLTGALGWDSGSPPNLNAMAIPIVSSAIDANPAAVAGVAAGVSSGAMSAP